VAPRRLGRTVAAACALAVLAVPAKAWLHSAAGRLGREQPHAISARPCSKTAASLDGVRAAVFAARPGSVVCVAAGSYGRLAVSARKSKQVVIRPARRNTVTLRGASLGGSHLTLQGFSVVGDEVTVLPASQHMTVAYNRITGGDHGIQAAPTTDVDVSDVTIRGNRLVGPFGEDAIRLNRYHDGPDRDSFGVLIEGNEITGVRENGNHSDCLQSVWGGDSLVFRRNYVHDNRCQGFFVKDQPGTVRHVVVSDNLFLRNAAPCDPPGNGCGQPAIVQLFGPMSGLTISRNTIWTPEGNSPTTLRSGGWGPVRFSRNVVYRLWGDSPAPFTDFSSADNVAARREGTWPARGVRIVRRPRFRAPARDDFRTGDGRGVTWRPAGHRFGP
jgi:parallel beta helix pectate lyase-like protein